MLAHTQISCVLCSRALTKAMAEGKEVTADTLSHEGECYRNSPFGPAIAEENSAPVLARSLLLDNNGDYLGDEYAVFADKIVGDGDTRAVTKFIDEQYKIMGDVVKDTTKCFPDIGHAIKCISTDRYNVAKKDTSLKGKNLLEPKRIRAICGDIISVLKLLRQKLQDLLNPSAEVLDSMMDECLDRLANIVPHHCGLHENCVADMCGFVKLKEDNPEWSDDKLDEESDKIARFNRECMSLSDEGREKVSGVISKKITKKNVGRLAEMKNINNSENFWNCTTVHSEGKRLNVAQAEAWKSALYGVCL